MTTPTERTWRSDASRNHEAILTAATAVLAMNPQASMAEVASASGAGRTTLYRHFPDREALVNAIYDRVLVEAGAITAHELRGEDDPVEALGSLCAALAGLGDRYRFLGSYEAKLNREGAAELRRREAPLREYLTRARKAGKISSDLSVDWIFAVLIALVGAAGSQSFSDNAERTEALKTTVRSLVGTP